MEQRIYHVVLFNASRAEVSSSGSADPADVITLLNMSLLNHLRSDHHIVIYDAYEALITSDEMVNDMISKKVYKCPQPECTIVFSVVECGGRSCIFCNKSQTEGV